ncbi:MAG: hypothetical protein ACP5HS_09425 [Anaerolineae bacterium]
MRFSKRRARIGGRASILGGASVLSLLLLLLVTPSLGWAQEPAQRAGIVVVHGDGSVVTRCVAFDEPTISGLTALQRAGLTLSTAAGPLGVTICSLDGEGCPTSDCFCECKSADCAYWNYYHRNADGSWAYANAGAASRQLQDGDVDGWVWGDGTTAPPLLSFEAICAAEPTGDSVPTEEALAPTATASATVAATMARIPTETATIRPTPTVEPTEKSEAVGATPSAEVATVTPSPTATATVPSTASSAPTRTAVVSEKTPVPPTEALAPSAEEEDASGAPLSYLGFAAILLVLGGGFLLLRRS